MGNVFDRIKSLRRHKGERFDEEMLDLFLEYFNSYELVKGIVNYLEKENELDFILDLFIENVDHSKLIDVLTKSLEYKTELVLNENFLDFELARKIEIFNNRVSEEKALEVAKEVGKDLGIDTTNCTIDEIYMSLFDCENILLFNESFEERSKKL